MTPPTTATIRVADDETRAIVNMAIGRLLRMMSRPYQTGDEQTFYSIRSIVLDHAPSPADHEPNWARDRNLGSESLAQKVTP